MSLLFIINSALLLIVFSITSTSAQPYCSFQNSLTIIGNDIGTPLPSPSSSVCCQACNQNPTCVAVVFVNLTCFQKSAQSPAVPEPTASLILMNGRTPAPTTTAPPTWSPSPPTPPPTPMPPGKHSCPTFQPYSPPPWAPPLKSTSDGGCGCAIGECEGVTPVFNWIFTACTTPSKLCPDPSDESCACAASNRHTPSLISMRYSASYQLTQDATTGNTPKWKMVKDTAVNVHNATNPLVFDSSSGRNDFSHYPTESDVFHRQPPRNKRIVNSESGGGGGWDFAFFPFNTTGVAPPGMMFVFAGRLQGAAWFALNQATLDRGPNNPTCNTQQNCWSTGSAGEIDFLEYPLLFGSTNRGDDTDSYRKMWFTTYNSAGRCFNQNLWKGSKCNPGAFCGANPIVHGDQSVFTNYFMQGGGAQYSLYNYNLDDNQEHVWAAIVDFRGVTIYRDPDFGGDLTLTNAATVLSTLAPNPSSPMTVGACGDDRVYNTEQVQYTCALYLPSHPIFMTPQQWSAATQLVVPIDMTRYHYPSSDSIVNSWGTGAQQCEASEMWWNLFVDSGQPIIPPSIYGAIRTDDVLATGLHPLVVPGVSSNTLDPNSWNGVITDAQGNPQTVQYGALESTCIPGFGQTLTNCPYSSQGNWATEYTNRPPSGMNVFMCDPAQCDYSLYLSRLNSNACPTSCALPQFANSMATQAHPGCGPTMSACPTNGSQIPSCSHMGPFGDVGEGAGNGCVIPGFPCNATMCNLVCGPDNFPYPN